MAEKRKPGRPKKIPLSDPSSERRQKAIEVMGYMSREGLSLRKACIKAGVEKDTFLDWRDENEEISRQYAKAREDMYDKIADETMEISDTPAPITPAGGTDSGYVQDKRLRVDTRKWLLSKLAPKKYGDKLELSGDRDNPLAVEFTRIERVIVKDSRIDADEEE